MFVSFGRSLRRGFGLRLGFRIRGWTAVFVAMFAAIFYLMWWSLLCCGYVLYGICWFYLLLWRLIKAPLKRLYIRVKEKRPRA